MLEGEAQKNNDDIKILIKSSVEEINNQNFNEALTLLNKAKGLAKEKNENNKLYDIYFNTALAQYYLSDFDNSLSTFNSAFKGFSENNKFEKSINCLRMMGYIFNQQGFQQKAIFNYIKALEIAQSISDEKLIADIQILLGLLFKETKDYENAIVNFEKALTYQIKSNNDKLQARVFNNLGICYHESENYALANNYYRKALRIKISLEDSISISRTILNLGELFMDTEELDSAIIYLQESLEIQRMNPDKSLALAANNLLGEAYRRVKQYNNSDFHLNKASLVLGEIESRRHSLDNYKYKKALSFDLKQYQNALYWDHKFDSLSDIYFEEERLKVQQIESDYQINQEKRKNEVLEIQKKQQEEISALRLWIVVVLVLILIIIFYLLFQRSKKNRRISMLNDELERRNEVIQTISKNNFHFSKNVFSEMEAMFDYQSSQLPTVDRHAFNKVRSSVNITANLFKSMFEKHDDSISDKKQDIKPYLEKIILESLYIFELTKNRVEVNMDLDSAFVKANQMYSLGQITNELITNSSKYAFKNEQRKGQLDISLKKNKQNLQLDFKDNGPGLPQSKRDGSLGMDLIRILTNSLEGRLEILESQQGVHFRINIPNEF